jgi:hypothetical protein
MPPTDEKRVGIHLRKVGLDPKEAATHLLIIGIDQKRVAIDPRMVSAEENWVGRERGKGNIQ